MKFKGLFVALMLGLVLVLAACSGGDSEGDDGEASGQKITIFQTKVEISEQMEELAKAYEEETGVKVEVIGTTGDDYFQQLQIKLNSNQGPSIFSLQDYKKATDLESYLYDLSGADFTKNIAENMGLMLGEKLVGIPYGVEGFGLVYNKDLVSEEDVKDYESFVNTLKELKDQGVNPISLSQEAYFLIGHISNYPFSIQEDTRGYIDQLTAGEVSMSETPEFQDFGKFMEAIREYGTNPMGVTYDQQIGDFATGKTAMIHQGNWAAGMLADYEYDFEVGMMPFPLNGNDKLAVGVGANWAVNGTKSEEEIQAAVDFLDWMHTSETGKRFIVEEFGFVPAMTNIEANDLDPLSKTVLEYSNSGETIPWAHNYYPPSLVTNDFVPAAEQFFLDDSVTGEQFIELLDQAWDNATK